MKAFLKWTRNNQAKSKYKKIHYFVIQGVPRLIAHVDFELQTNDKR